MLPTPCLWRNPWTPSAGTDVMVIGNAQLRRELDKRRRTRLACRASAENIFGGEKQLSGPKKLLEDMPASTRYMTCAAIVAGALVAGYAVGSQAKKTPNAALAGALALGAVGGATAYVMNSMAPEVAVVHLHNALVHHPSPKDFKGEEIEKILQKYGISRGDSQFNAELRNLYDCFVSSVIPTGNEDLSGDEAEVISSFKSSLGLDDPDAAAVHIEIGRRIFRQRLETGDRETAVEERKAFQKLVYVSSLVFGEASKFLLPWKRVFKVTDAQVEIAIRDNAQKLFSAKLTTLTTEMTVEQLLELRQTQMKVKLSDEIAAELLKAHTQKHLEGYISRALAVLKSRTRVKDVHKIVEELESMLAYNASLASLSSKFESLQPIPGLAPVSVIGGQYDSDRQMDDLKQLYRTYLIEAVFSGGYIDEDKMAMLNQLKNVFGMGNREADIIMTEVTTKVYRRRLSQAVSGGDLDAASSKAVFLQNLCDSLQLDPAIASRVHEEIYRHKLEQCVSDGSLSEKDISALLRLRVLLCVPQESVDAAHADICGRIFAKVVDNAIAAGIDSYDADTKRSVSNAVRGLRLKPQAALDIASKAVRSIFLTYVKRSKTAGGRTESAKELKKMLVFNNLVVTELIDDIQKEPKTGRGEEVKSVQVLEAKEEDNKEEEEDEMGMMQTLRKTKPGKKRQGLNGKPPQTMITLKDDLEARDKKDLYRTYLLYCISGETTNMPFGSALVTQRDESEFERLSELGDILGLSSVEIKEIHSGLAEQAFRSQAELILADGKVDKRKMSRLHDVQKELGVPQEIAEKVITSITTTRMAGAIDAAVSQGQLTVEEVKKLREAGVSIDSMVSKQIREKMFRSAVNRALSSGSGVFDEEQMTNNLPAELGLDSAKCKKIVEEIAKQRLSNSLVQSIALLRQKKPADAVASLKDLLACDRVVKSEKLKWSVEGELMDLFVLFYKSMESAKASARESGEESESGKESGMESWGVARLQELFGLDDATADKLKNNADSFNLIVEEEEFAF